MAITIDGTGTITGISAGGLPDGIITTDDIAANAVTTAKLGSNEVDGLCKVWIRFNGSGTVAIRNSFNVSSITDNGTGDYTVNFTTALTDQYYAVITDSGTTQNTTEINITAVDYFQMQTKNTSGTLIDQGIVCAAIFL